MKRFDLTVVPGLLLGLCVIGTGAALDGVRPRFLWQPTAALIVFGGTLAALWMQAGSAEIGETLRAIATLMRPTEDNHKFVLARLVHLAATARKQGSRVYEKYAEVCEDSLIARGVLLLADYPDVKTVRLALDEELEREDERGQRAAVTLEAAGGFAPTFGILGAVLGLISVLRVLDNPEALGLGIATAFVATIYGIGLANLFCFPVAARLRQGHEQQMQRRQEIVAALLALAARESPLTLARRYPAHSLPRVSSGSRQ